MAGVHKFDPLPPRLLPDETADHPTRTKRTRLGHLSTTSGSWRRTSARTGRTKRTTIRPNDDRQRLVEQAKAIVADDADAGDRFGFSVAVSGPVRRPSSSRPTTTRPSSPDRRTCSAGATTGGPSGRNSPPTTRRSASGSAPRWRFRGPERRSSSAPGRRHPRGRGRRVGVRVRAVAGSVRPALSFASDSRETSVGPAPGSLGNRVPPPRLDHSTSR